MRKQMTEFSKSIATVCLSGDFAEKLDAIQKAGFSGIEIFEQDFIGFDMNPQQTRQMISDHGLDVMLFQPFRDFEGLPSGPLRERAFSRAKYKFETMNQLGCDLILICSSVHPQAKGGIDRCADDFAELGEIAQSFDVRVGFEALAWGKFINDHRDAWEVVRRADHRHVGLILDSYHTLSRKIDPQSICSIPGDKIFFVQLADAPAVDMDYLYLSRHFRNMPGEGDLDIPSFMDAVFATGYQGPLSLEIFNDQFRRSDPNLVAQDGHRSLVYLADQMFSRNQPHRAGLLPEPVAVTGIAYVECAISSKHLSYYVDFLEQIGFVLRSEHKSKKVLRFEQGMINLLLNYDPDYAGAKAIDKVGLIVSEIALQTDDANSALARALGLGAKALHLSKSEEETSFPAIEGINNSIIRFVGSDMNIWEDDFNPARNVAVQKTVHKLQGNLHAFDHIAQTMSHDEMLSWSLFYTSIFAMKKSAIVDVVDPDGIIKSQVLTADSGKLCFTLNGSDAQRTRASKFLHQSPAGYVQHIAFQAKDLMSLAGHICQSEFVILKQTDNYYDDIQAKFGLSDDYCENLKDRNLLYDEDEQGQFLHLYCHLKETELFFEFVQRIDHYAGFGAANAPYRLSAQRRMRHES